MKQEKGKKRELYNSSSSPKFTEEYTKEQNVDLINVHLNQSDDQFRMVNTGYFQKNKMLDQQKLLKHSDFRGLLIPKVDNSMFKIYNYGYFHKQMYQNSFYVNNKFRKINQLQKQGQTKQQFQKINQLINENTDIDDLQIDKYEIKELNNDKYQKKKLFPNKFLNTLIDQYGKQNN